MQKISNHPHNKRLTVKKIILGLTISKLCTLHVAITTRKVHNNLIIIGSFEKNCQSAAKIRSPRTDF